MKNKVGIQDIATALGVSRNTVTKALQGSDIVAAGTRQRIIKKALEMGYEKVPEDAREAHIKRGNTETTEIAVIAKKEVSEFTNRLLFGIADAMKDTSYKFSMYFVDEEDERKLILPRAISEGDVGGIIGLSVFSRAYTQKLFKTHIPIVFYDMPFEIRVEEFKADVLLVDNYSCIYEIVAQLVRQGKRRIGFIGDIYYCKTAYDRWVGFKSALSEHHVGVEEKLCLTGYMPELNYAYEVIHEMLQKTHNCPDALICANDEVALQVMRHLIVDGYKTPDDIAVIGFNSNVSTESSQVDSDKVRQDKEYIGKRLFEALDHRMKNIGRPYEKIYVNIHVVL